MVRSAPQYQRRGGDGRAADVGDAQLAQGGTADESPVRPDGPRNDHGQGVDLLQRAGELLSDLQQLVRPGGGDRATVPGRAIAVREVSSSSVREVRAGGLLQL